MTDRSTLAPAFRAAAEAAVVCRPTGLAVMRIDGDDATAFLQGQLSSDIAALAPGKAQWSSYNSPKGRMLASLRVWRDPDGAFGALVAADLAASIVKRLSMFVLRANVRVAARTSASTQAVGGPAAGAAIEARFRCAALPDGAVAAADRRATVVGLDDRRFVVVADAPDDDAVAHDLARAATPSPDAIWRWLAVEAGVPTITAATSDQFVPQMLNWDAIGGVNFQKGCYPGQEIVARMRYLGRLKERLYAFHVDTDREPETGARIFGRAFGATPCGTVINAAPAPAGGHAMLAVVQTSAFDAGGLVFGTELGPPLSPMQLPYAVPQLTPARTRLG